MKLNENGDFCLLYVEPADDKQSLFATISEQQKPVVLMLPLAGQPRSRLFQRPEDFSDLKYVRRQSGVSIVFLTAGSERLAQMAARYGFPSYPSVDDFADFLAHGRRSTHDEDEGKGYPLPLRGVRTGPLIPSSALAQLAALRQPLPSRPLNSEPWTGHDSGVRPSDYADYPAEYLAAFHEAQTRPIGEAARAALAASVDDASAMLPATPPGPPSARTVSPPDWSRTVQRATPQAYGMSSPSGADMSERFHEPPRRRTTPIPATEPHSRHPGWEPQEHMFEPSSQRALARPPLSSGSAREPRVQTARPTRDLREQALAMAGLPGIAPTRPLSDAGMSGTAPRAVPGPAGVAPARPLSDMGMSGTASRPVAGPSGMIPSRSLSPITDAVGTPVMPGPGARPERERVSQALPPVTRRPQRRGSIWPLLVILSLLIIVGGALGSFVAIARVAPTAPAAAQPVGALVFQSSEQLNQNTSQGIDDQVQISLHGLGTPAPGKSYYAWLLGDTAQTEAQSIMLGKLNVTKGAASLFYPGGALHTNLLQITSRFLVTEESSSVTPLMPSPNTSNWRYYGALPAIPDPNDAHHYSFLNHLRHLLADEPILDELELPGGLNNWFTRNTEELIQLTSSARDHWQNNRDLTSVRAQGVQILAYLDGMSFLAQDMPSASANVPVSLDTHLAALGLLNVRGTTQNPPGYLDQIVYHLNGLLNAPGAPGNTRTIVNQVLPELSNVTTWLQTLRKDDKKLLALTDTQLSQASALSLLDDMALQASNAYSGYTNPSTGQFQQGIVWIHQQLQSLATINISTYVVGQTPVPEVAPSSKAGPAVVEPLWSDLWRAWRAML